MNVELFPCSGGMAEGFRRAGVVFDVAFDYSADACASYEANHGHRPMQMDVRDLVRMARLGFRPARFVDLLVADPPCTPWSRAGKRLGVDDERDMLGQTIDLIEAWMPRAYLIGNVPGLDDSTQWHHVQAALARLSRVGYCVVDYAKLDAADYGVPQHRVRPFWFGHRGGDCLRWPAPTHCDPLELASESLPGLARLTPWITCRQALADIPIDKVGRIAKRKLSPKHPPSPIDAPAHTITTSGDRQGSGGNTLGSAPTRHRVPVHESTLDEPARTITTQCRAPGHATTVRVPQGMRVGHVDRVSDTITSQVSRIGAGSAHVLEWPWDTPSTTVMVDERIALPGHHREAGSFPSQPGVVVLSELAAAVLQGFPTTWTFHGKTKRERWSQLGMAMPPALAHAVARSVVEQRDTTVVRKSTPDVAAMVTVKP